MSEFLHVALEVRRLRCGQRAPVMGCYTALTLALLCLCCPGWGAPSTGTNAPTGFRLKPGFRLEMVAASPLIAAPVAIAFDENGRLFVAESPEVFGGRATNAAAGRVRVLEDSDGTGQYSASTIYADKLPWASALACSSGGVFVAAGPEILYLKDTRTNGIADVRKVVFGIEAATNTPHAQALPNTFTWGLDNRIHSASGGTDADAITPRAAGGPALPLDSAFAFDPRAFTLASEGIAAQSGLALGNGGRWLASDFQRPLRQPLFPTVYRERNTFFPPPAQMADVLSPATPVFRPGAQATNAPVLAWLTNAQGCVVYRGNAFPTNYLGNAFIPDPSARVIHRAVLRESGLLLSAARAPDELRTEFLTSSDTAFRPVQIVNAPDGALYVVDAQDGRDLGRIYRIAPVGFTPPKPPRLGKMRTPELVAMLSHTNGWQRDTAARLLYERRDKAAAEPLGNVLYRSRMPLARLHALQALDGLGPLSQLNLATALRDADPQVREHAVRLAPKAAPSGVLPDPLWNQLRVLTTDPSLRVRYQLGLTLGELRQPGSARVLADLLWQNPDNQLIEAAVFSSLADQGGEVFSLLAGDAPFRASNGGPAILRRLAAMIGVRADAQEVGQTLAFLAQAPLESQPALTLLTALGQGMHRAGGFLAQLDPQGLLTRFYSDASNLLLGSTTIDAWRVAGIELLSVAPFGFSDNGDLLLLPLGTAQPEAVQSAALATLGGYSDPRVAPALIGRWRNLTPRLRNEAMAALLRRAERFGAVLDALENGDLTRADFTPGVANLLRTEADAASAERAIRLLGPLSPERPEPVQRLRRALALRGTPAAGRDIFQARCAACHQPPGIQPGIGPELATARIHGKEWAFQAILEPSRAVRPGYETAVVETAAGEILWGILPEANQTTVTLQQASGGPMVLRRSNIVYLQPRSWSLMPDGLEQDLTAQDLADLLEYITAQPR